MRMGEEPVTAVKAGKRAVRPGKLLLFGLMVLVTLVYIYPFFWLFISCFKSNGFRAGLEGLWTVQLYHVLCQHVHHRRSGGAFYPGIGAADRLRLCLV